MTTDPAKWKYLWGVDFDRVDPEDRLYATIIVYFFAGLLVLAATFVVTTYTALVMQILGIAVSLVAIGITATIIGAIAVSLVDTIWSYVSNR